MTSSEAEDTFRKKEANNSKPMTAFLNEAEGYKFCDIYEKMLADRCGFIISDFFMLETRMANFQKNPDKLAHTTDHPEDRQKFKQPNLETKISVKKTLGILPFDETQTI